jgi:hypothetical protein
MKLVQLLTVVLLTTGGILASNVSTPDHALTHASASMDAQLRTDNGAKPRIISANATVAPSPAAKTSKRRPNDLVLVLTLMAIPVIFVCAAHIWLACLRLITKKLKAEELPTFLSPNPSVALAPPDVCEYVSPAAPLRPKSKSVTWQSPFETKARPSHRTASTHGAMTASELHFVLVATPDKRTPSRKSRRAFQQQHSEQASEEPIPQYRLDRLDSSPREECEELAPTRSSSLSLGSSPVRPQQDTTSPVVMLHDSGEYDSDSPRVSVSSSHSEDPEILRVLDDAMRWTQMAPDFEVSSESVHRPTRAMRSSSSLDDFRHDLHHEHNEEDPDQITRSSEYSF